MKHVHMIGIGGSGLSAIARVLLERGVRVSGSDRQESPATQELRAAGAHVFVGHRAENIRGADLIVRSSAVTDDNVEVQAARAAGLPVLKRAQFLGQLLEGYQVIAIAGTHGKTTTTAMLAWMLEALGEKPSYIIGGISLNLRTNARAGQGPYFVIEADEYDHMFLGLTPRVAVVMNVDYDHPDCYPSKSEYHQAFQRFVDRILQDGLLIVCVDDLGAYRLGQEVAQKGIRRRTFGLGRWLGRDNPLSYARNLRVNRLGGYSFEAILSGDRQGEEDKAVEVHLQVPGRHNVLNALAALSVIEELNLSLEKAALALAEFRGTGRRFEVVGEVGDIILIDDYAHHPAEIQATLQAARTRYPQRSVWAVWQPHTYSRTRALLDDFAVSFKEADHVLVTEIYAARENSPEDGFSARQVAERIQHTDVHYVADLGQAVAYLLQNVRSGDIILVLSAGDADQINRLVLEGLRDVDDAQGVPDPRSSRI